MKILFCTKCANLQRLNIKKCGFQRCQCGTTWVIYENPDELRCSTDAVILEISMRDLLCSVREHQPVTLNWVRESDLERDLPAEAHEECGC